MSSQTLQFKTATRVISNTYLKVQCIHHVIRFNISFSLHTLNPLTSQGPSICYKCVGLNYTTTLLISEVLSPYWFVHSLLSQFFLVLKPLNNYAEKLGLMLNVHSETELLCNIPRFLRAIQVPWPMGLELGGF